MTNERHQLQARLTMLRREAALGLEQALEAGPAWPGFKDQVAIAHRCEDMAAVLEARIKTGG